MHNGKETVLFLEGDDSARSRMARGWLSHLAGDCYEARTAGPFPASSARPEAVEAMREAGVEIPSGPGVHTRRYLGERFDRVYAICDQAAEPCPVFPGGAVCWPIPDPAAAGASPEERLDAYRRARDKVLDLVRETFGVR